LLGFGQSSLVDHVAVLLEEGVRSFLVPRLDFSLNLIQVFNGKVLESLGLAHVAFSLSFSALFNSSSEADQRGNKIERF